MANKPLKSIKFPNLSDTYTIPEVDDTLTQSGNAADAKKTGDKIGDLTQTVDTIVDATLAQTGKAADAQKTGLITAPQYSTSATYNVGDYVIYNGSLYRCTTKISTAESWTSGHWTAAKVGSELNDLKSAIQYNAVYSIGNLIPNKYIDNATGNETAYSGWSATDYIPVTSGQRIFIKSSRSSNYNKYYDSAKNAFAGGGVYIASGENSIIVPDGAAFIRLSNTTEAMQSAIIKLLPETDITFSESGISADAKEVGQYINSTRNIFPKNEITHKFNQGKYYDSSLVLQSNSGSVYTDEIVCTGYQNVVIKTSSAIESNVTRCVGFKKSDDSIRNVFTLKSIVDAGWCKSVDDHFETTIPISTNEDKFYMSIQSDNTPTEIVLTPRISDVLLNPEVAYVSNDGNDANTGMDRNNAFKTIQKAIDRGAKVILVKEGTYAGFSMVEKNGITISVDPYYSTYTAGTDEDDPVIIIDGDDNQIIGVNLNRCCNCRFENIEVKNCKGIGFKVFMCEACVFTGCSAHDIGVDKTETSIGGFVIQYSNADFYYCVVYNIATTTAGAATGSYDGFNIHYTGVTNFYFAEFRHTICVLVIILPILVTFFRH